MENVTWDIALFEALNFDGGTLLDSLMTIASGVVVWLPLYALIVYMVWRRYSWRGVVALFLSVVLAMGMADLIAGIFKHTGPLGEVWPSFPARLRPMFSEGLDSVHVPSYDHGQYGTVSAHAATIIAMSLLSSVVVARRWFTWIMVAVALVICYSRIYLACHFPQDIVLGAAVGLASASAGIALFNYICPLCKE
ncbi:MAG: phosphatase PAP2 family protein [Alistipes sp.]|nr:phosphatase PAP2 family protein [Alistipes sp.]